MQEGLIARRSTALWLALAILPLPSGALELGPPEVLSALGEKLDARIPVRVREGEWFHARCLSLAPATQVAPFPDASVLSVERQRSATHLRIRSGAPIQEPALAFGVSSTCAGAAAMIGAPVTLLVDPPRVDGAPRKPASALPPSRPDPGKVRHTVARIAPAATPAPAPAPPSQASAAAPAPAAAAIPSPVPAPAARAPAAADFVLKLSSGDIDLGRTRQFDEPARARLRERLRLLDSDDQVAEMLSMRDNLRRLEARVAELQLKLASMPQAFPAPAAVEAAKPLAQAPKSDAAKIETPVAATPKGEVGPAPSPAPASKAAPETTPPIVGALESFEGRLVALGIAILVLLGMLGAWLWSRWRHPGAREEEPVDEGEATVLMARDDPVEIAPVAPENPIEIAPPARAEVTSDAALATRLEEDTEALRRRYIEERFPEIRAGTIALDDPASVVKGARLFYEDGAIPRAVELLRFAIEDRPGELRPWLALFEIYRLERLSGEYTELARRFRERHGVAPQWPKVCSFGRELDPSHPLFREAPVNTLETIGPRAARRMAPADPLAENWLDAPMDFDNEVLATELRRSLMAGARVEDRDLVPNPMPALRSVEMFSVG